VVSIHLQLNFQTFKIQKRKLLTAEHILARIVLNPSGGKYVPPIIGLRSGVNQTLIGQPPRPLVAFHNHTSTHAFKTRASHLT